MSAFVVTTGASQPAGQTPVDRTIAAEPWSVRLPPQRMLVLPLGFILALAGVALLPPIRQNPKLLSAFLGAVAVLGAWTAVLLAVAPRRSRTLTLELVLRRQHYLQACAQGSVLLYWGWSWREVYERTSSTRRRFHSRCSRSACSPPARATSHGEGRSPTRSSIRRRCT
jgi:hypothetical protein